MLFKWWAISPAQQQSFKYLKKWITTTLWYLEDKLLCSNDNKTKHKWHYVRKPNKRKSCSHGPLSIYMPERWGQRWQASLGETELAIPRAPTIFLSTQPMKAISPVLSPVYSRTFMVLLCSVLASFNSAFISSEVCVFLSIWDFTFSAQPPWNPPVSRDTRSLGCGCWWYKTLFFKGISNTLLSYFGCKSSRKMTQDGVIIKIPGALVLSSRQLSNLVLLVHVPSVTTPKHGLRTVSLMQHL